MTTPDGPFEFVELTAEAHAAVRAETLPGQAFRQTATRLANGNYRVPLQRSTIAAVRARAFPGESVSDTIVRVIKGGSLQ